MKYDKIIRAGIAGCGNTLIQLILQHLIGKSKIIGTHRYVNNLETPIDLSPYRIGIIMPCRDFRSVIASDIRKNKQLPTLINIERTYKQLFTPMYTEFHKFRTEYQYPEDILLLRYPLFYDNYDYLLDQLQSFLAIIITNQQRDQIKKQFSMQANKKRISQFKLNDWNDVDEKTQLHGNHIGTGEPESWKTFFPLELHNFITKLMWSELIEYQWEN